VNNDFYCRNNALKSKNQLNIYLKIQKEKAPILSNLLLFIRKVLKRVFKKSIVTKSTWKQWDKFSVMEEPFRFNHKSHQYITDFLLKEMGNSPFSLLDCGVLSAVTYRKIQEAKLNVKYTGIDIGKKIIADCRRRFPDIDWRILDVQNLKLDDNSYDIVLIRHLLEHLPYYDKAIKEAKRVAKKYVLLCLFFPLGNKDELRKKIKRGGRYYINKYGKNRFKGSLQKEFSNIQEIYIEDPQRDNQLFICRV